MRDDAERADASRAAGERVAVPVLLVLALLTAIAPFATDLYLPAFPQMADDLATDATGVQLTLTAFLLGVTVGQLVFGPLSDRLGRLRPLVWGSILCVLAGVVTVLAPSVEVLVAARLLQGLGGAAGMVIGRAIVSDIARGRAAARAFSLMMIVGGVAPVVAPLLGGALAAPLGWRGLMGIVLGMSVLMVIAVLVVLRETRSPADRASARAPRAALRSRVFIGYTVAFAFAFSVMMGYISASPFVYQDMMGLDAAGYGVAFGINATALIVVSAVSARLTGIFSVRALLGTGLVILVASSAAVAVLALAAVPAWWLSLPLFTAVGALGLVMGNATALALAAVPTAAGMASAILGAAQFGLAAIVSPLVSLGGTGSALPLGIVMLTCAAVAVAGFAASGVGGRRTPPSHTTPHEGDPRSH